VFSYKNVLVFFYSQVCWTRLWFWSWSIRWWVEQFWSWSQAG